MHKNMASSDFPGDKIELYISNYKGYNSNNFLDSMKFNKIIN